LLLLLQVLPTQRRTLTSRSQPQSAHSHASEQQDPSVITEGMRLDTWRAELASRSASHG
jgi:DnaJ-domain-containing protein 1